MECEGAWEHTDRKGARFMDGFFGVQLIALTWQNGTIVIFK